MIAHTAVKSGWKWAVCSFENTPAALHRTKIPEKIGGKAFDVRRDPQNKTAPSDRKMILSFIERYSRILQMEMFAKIHINYTWIVKKILLIKQEMLVLLNPLKLIWQVVNMKTSIYIFYKNPYKFKFYKFYF